MESQSRKGSLLFYVTLGSLFVFGSIYTLFLNKNGLHLAEETGNKLPGNKEKEREVKFKKEKVCLDSRFAQDLRSWNLNRLPIAVLRLSSNLRPHRLDSLNRAI